MKFLKCFTLESVILLIFIHISTVFILIKHLLVLLKQTHQQSTRMTLKHCNRLLKHSILQYISSIESSLVLLVFSRTDAVFSEVWSVETRTEPLPDVWVKVSYICSHNRAEDRAIFISVKSSVCSPSLTFRVSSVERKGFGTVFHICTLEYKLLTIR